jgi:RNA polymerase sigma-70 factor, ECF subfamily
MEMELVERDADRALVERTLSGDLEGFGELHRRYYRRLLGVVHAILRDRVQAEDLVQDAYLSALRELRRLREPDRFYPWLCRIAVNRAIEEKRRSQRRAALDARSRPVTEAPSKAEERLLAAERTEALKAALERLPEGQRAAVVLRFFEELPMRTVARVLGCEEVTARTQVFRGLRKLGVFLKARKGDSR